MQRKREQENREGKKKSDIKNSKKKEFLKGGGGSYLGEMNDNRHSKGDKQQGSSVLSECCGSLSQVKSKHSGLYLTGKLHH